MKSLEHAQIWSNVNSKVAAYAMACLQKGLEVGSQIKSCPQNNTE